MRVLIMVLLLLPGCYLTHTRSSPDDTPDAAVPDAGVWDAPPPIERDGGTPTTGIVIPGNAPRLGWDGDGLSLVHVPPVLEHDTLRRISADLVEVGPPVPLDLHILAGVGFREGTVAVCGPSEGLVGLQLYDASGAASADAFPVAGASCHSVQPWGAGWALLRTRLERDRWLGSVAWIDGGGATVASAEMGEIGVQGYALVAAGEDIVVAWVTPTGAIALRRFAPDASVRARFDLFEAGAQELALAVHADGTIGLLVDATWTSGDLSFVRFSSALEPLGERVRLAGSAAGALFAPQLVALDEGWCAAWADTAPDRTAVGAVAFAARLESDGAMSEGPLLLSEGVRGGYYSLSLLRAPVGTFIAIGRGPFLRAEIVVQPLPWR